MAFSGSHKACAIEARRSRIIIQWDKFKGTGNFTIPKIYVIGIL
jgi:hypothetical protein